MQGMSRSSKRQKKLTVLVTEKEHQELNTLAKNSYAGYLATFIYRVLQEILKGNIKIK